MQVRVVEGGTQAFDALMYQAPEQNVVNYLANSVSNAVTALGGLSDTFVATATQMYNKFTDSNIINNAKALVHSLGTHTSDYYIYPVTTDTMGTANYVMQQYIMCNPQVQELYQDNMCNGFESTYYDTEQGITGEARMDYQRVMDGVLQFDKTGEGYTKHYSNVDELEELDHMNKHAILSTWEHVANMIAADLDPTDPDGGSL